MCGAFTEEKFIMEKILQGLAG